jgi:hypothetical protein
LSWRHDLLDYLAIIRVIISRRWLHHVCWHFPPPFPYIRLGRRCLCSGELNQASSRNRVGNF